MPSLGDWAQLGQALISAAGFYFLFSQIKAVNQTIERDTHSKLYSHYLEFNKLLLEKPHLRPYFYDNRILVMNDNGKEILKLRAEIDMACEILCGLLEHAALQLENICGDAGENCWKEYTRVRFTNSVELTKYYVDNREYYTKRLQQTIKGLIPNLEDNLESPNAQSEAQVAGVLISGSH